MEQNIIKRQVKRRNKAEIQLLLEAFAKAGQSVQSFCDERNIGKSTFHKWQSRYKSEGEDQRAATAFADIHIVAAENSALLFAEVRGIKIYQPVSAGYLKALLS